MIILYEYIIYCSYIIMFTHHRCILDIHTSIWTPSSIHTSRFYTRRKRKKLKIKFVSRRPGDCNRRSPESNHSTYSVHKCDVAAGDRLLANYAPCAMSLSRYLTKSLRQRKHWAWKSNWSKIPISKILLHDSKLCYVIYKSALVQCYTSFI